MWRIDTHTTIPVAKGRHRSARASLGFGFPGGVFVEGGGTPGMNDNEQRSRSSAVSRGCGVDSCCLPYGDQARDDMNGDIDRCVLLRGGGEVSEGVVGETVLARPTLCLWQRLASRRVVCLLGRSRVLNVVQSHRC